MNSQLKLRAWQFTYLKGESESKFETLPFYLRNLREFLKKNLGKVVWIKGGLIEKPAYLLFYSELSEDVYQLLVKPLKNGGRFGVIPVQNPIEIARKYLREERIALGYLDLKGEYIGSPESLYTSEEQELQEKVRAGIKLKDGYTIIRAEGAEIKNVERRKAPNEQPQLAPMLILTNAVELLNKDGKIIGVDTVKQKMGIWLDLVEEPI